MTFLTKKKERIGADRTSFLLVHPLLAERMSLEKKLPQKTFSFVFHLPLLFSLVELACVLQLHSKNTVNLIKPYAYRPI